MLASFSITISLSAFFGFQVSTPSLSIWPIKIFSSLPILRFDFSLICCSGAETPIEYNQNKWVKRSNLIASLQPGSQQQVLYYILILNFGCWSTVWLFVLATLLSMLTCITPQRLKCSRSSSPPDSWLSYLLPPESAFEADLCCLWQLWKNLSLIFTCRSIKQLLLETAAGRRWLTSNYSKAMIHLTTKITRFSGQE